MSAESNKTNSLQLVYTKPTPIYKDTKANIEALTGLTGGEEAYATDTGEWGHYDAVNNEWDWHDGGDGGGHEIQEGGTPLDSEPALNFDADDFNVSDDPGVSTDVEINDGKWATKTYAESLVVGLWDDRGNYNASVNAYPSSGGSGTAGAILKGDIWTVSVGGTLPTGQVVVAGDTVRALIDTPGNTQANWAINETNIGYVAENQGNKTSTITGNESSTTLYSTIKGFVDWVKDGLVGILTAKTTPIDADYILGSDSTASHATRKYTWANIKATLKTYYDLFYLLTIATNANDIFRVDSPGGASLFTATIATLPGGGTTLTYTPVSGSEGCLVPTSTSQLAKLRLYNTTRGTYALISNCVTGTNTITFVSGVPSGSVVGDTITIVSQTVSGGSTDWIDLEITDATLLGKSVLYIFVSLTNVTANNFARTHPTEAYATSKIYGTNVKVTNIPDNNGYFIKMNSNAFSIAWSATTNAPTNVIVRQLGYLP